MHFKNKKIVSILVVLLCLLFGYLYGKEVAKLFYPFSYQEIIMNQAQANGVDPYLVAAIINVESKFQPLAVSPRGARGLMQLMPGTAEWASAKLEVAYDSDLLFDPKYNIYLGTWYLSNLMEEFQGNLVVSLAAYNGGRGRVNQWLEEGIWQGTLVDLKAVPFKETRNFIQKVLRNYYFYRLIYE